jgi:hypothetical protein
VFVKGERSRTGAVALTCAAEEQNAGLDFALGRSLTLEVEPPLACVALEHLRALVA